MSQFCEQDFRWMQEALKFARLAEQQGEVPVGAVLVLNDQIIGQGYNQTIATSDPSAHAEIVALRAGATNQKNYRLLNSTLYVTLEPCLMCAGALVHARIKRLVYGALDPRTGVIESQGTWLSQSFLNHRVDSLGGVAAHECGELLRSFFKLRRKKADKPNIDLHEAEAIGVDV